MVGEKYEEVKVEKRRSVPEDYRERIRRDIEKASRSVEHYHSARRNGVGY